MKARRIAFPRSAYGMTCLRRLWTLAVLSGFKHWLLALALCLSNIGSVCALESWGLPDMSQDDKREHAAIGFAAAAITDLALRCEDHPPNRWVRLGADLLTSAVVGTGIEWAQQQANEGRMPRWFGTHHDVDPKDAVACVYGGGALVALSFTWEW